MDPPHLIRIYDSVVADDGDVEKLIADAWTVVKEDHNATLKRRRVMRSLVIIMTVILTVACVWPFSPFWAEGEALVIMKQVALACGALLSGLAVYYFMEGYLFAGPVSRSGAAVEVLGSMYPPKEAAAPTPTPTPTPTKEPTKEPTKGATPAPTPTKGPTPAPAQTDAVIKLAALDTLTVDNLRAVEECVAALRSFSGATRLRPMDVTDVDAILSDIIVPGMTAARLKAPLSRSMIASECSKTCGTTVTELRAALGKGQSVTNADVTAAWAACPNAMVELCREEGLPAGARCALACVENARLSDQKIYDVDGNGPSKSNRWSLRNSGSTEGACFEAAVKDEKVEAALFLRGDGGACHMYERRDGEAVEAVFEPAGGALGTLLVRSGSAIVPPQSDAVAVGRGIAGQINDTYGAFDVREHADTVYGYLKEADALFDVHRDWYRDCFNALASAVRPPRPGAAASVADVSGSTEALKAVDGSAFTERYVLPLTLMHGALCSQKVRDIKETQLELKAAKDRYGKDNAAIWLAGAAFICGVAVLLISDIHFRETEPEAWKKAKGRFGVPTAVMLACAVSLFWAVVLSLRKRSLTRARHNIETRKRNTEALHKASLTLLTFVYGLSGTPAPAGIPDVDFKRALHFGETDFVKSFGKPGQPMYDILKEGDRATLLRGVKEVVLRFDACNTAAGGSAVPLPVSDILIYVGGMVFMAMVTRYLYTHMDVPGVLTKLSAVQRELPAAALDVAHAGAAARLRGLVVCEDGIEDVFDVIKWALMVASLIVSVLFIGTVNDGTRKYDRAIDYMKLRSRCAA